MKNELRSSGHTVGETNLHLQFTPAYRRDIFSEPLARELTTAYIVQRSQEMKIEVAAIECGPDHLHLFVKQWKNWKIPVLAGQLKSYSSRKMRKGYTFLFSDKLWAKNFGVPVIFTEQSVQLPPKQSRNTLQKDRRNIGKKLKKRIRKPF